MGAERFAESVAAIRSRPSAARRVELRCGGGVGRAGASEEDGLTECEPRHDSASSRDVGGQ